jgi:N-acylneuraminate cytidylyltransferase
LNNPKIHSSGIGYAIPNWRVVDIDTEDDWLRAEKLRDSISGCNTSIKRDDK